MGMIAMAADFQRRLNAMLPTPPSFKLLHIARPRTAPALLTGNSSNIGS
jgi:hypothetical protein